MDMVMPSSELRINTKCFFWCRRRADSTSSASSSSSPSSTSWESYSLTDSDSRSTISSDSRASASFSQRIRALPLKVDDSSRAYTTRCFDNEANNSHFLVDSQDTLSCFPTGDSTSKDSSWTSSSECECVSRTRCPHFIQRHIKYLQSYEWRRIPGTLVSAYYISMDEYAQANDALSFPSAKLARACAEYNWAISRRSDDTRLLAPRVQEQRLLAEAKIAAAEKDWDMANIRRWEKAQLLMDIGKF